MFARSTNAIDKVDSSVLRSTVVEFRNLLANRSLERVNLVLRNYTFHDLIGETRREPPPSVSMSTIGLLTYVVLSGRFGTVVDLVLPSINSSVTQAARAVRHTLTRVDTVNVKLMDHLYYDHARVLRITRRCNDERHMVTERPRYIVIYCANWRDANLPRPSATLIGLEVDTAARTLPAVQRHIAATINHMDALRNSSQRARRHTTFVFGFVASIVQCVSLTSARPAHICKDALQFGMGLTPMIHHYMHLDCLRIFDARQPIDNECAILRINADRWHCTAALQFADKVTVRADDSSTDDNDASPPESALRQMLAPSEQPDGRRLTESRDTTRPTSWESAESDDECLSPTTDIS